VGQLVIYLDAAQDRVTLHGHTRMSELALAARLGNAEQKSWRRWWSKQQGRIKKLTGQTALTGQALENAITGLAARNPEYVVRGAA
jgi:hypothetical protein